MAFPEGKGSASVAARAGGRCELCGSTDSLEFSHRQARGQGGGWEPSNGVRLCHACHHWVESNPIAAVAAGQRVTSMQDPHLVPVWLRTPWPGWFLLDDDGCYEQHYTDRGKPAVLPPQVALNGC